MTAEWTHSRKEYGPHCKGESGQHHGSASWRVRFLQFFRDYQTEYWHLEMAASGKEKVEADAQAACDEQVARWQEMFPMLEIVAKEQAHDR